MLTKLTGEETKGGEQRGVKENIEKRERKEREKGGGKVMFAT